jgi:hypothetical protein
MKVLVPHISCVITAEQNPTAQQELDNALSEGYVHIYITTPGKILKHHKLSGEDRFIRLRVDSIPGYTEETAVFSEGLKFLPAGKIPFDLYKKILGFFKEVIKVKKSNLEAMIWVLWEQDKGYYLHVPNQSVSKASATYDWSDIPGGATLVLDVHSHNTMGAFFSGTDNGDDGKNICYSGVIGNLDKEPQSVWRFNYLSQNSPVEFETVFDVPPKEATDIPSEWVSKLSNGVAFSPYVGKYKVAQGGFYTGAGTDTNTDMFSSWDEWVDQRYGKNKLSNKSVDERYNSAISLSNRGVATKEEELFIKSEMRSGSTYFEASNDYRDALQAVKQGTCSSVWLWNKGKVADTATNPRVNTFRGFDHLIKEANKRDKKTKAKLKGVVRSLGKSEDLSIASLGLTMQEDATDLSDDAVFARMNEVGDEFANNAAVWDDDSQYNEIAINRGVDVATAFSVINDSMVELADQDDLLEAAVSDMVGLMSDEAKTKTLTAVFEALPADARARIETNGL